MADYPCDMHLQRYSGPSTRIYINAFREEQVFKLKMSICNQCLEAAMSDLVPRALYETSGKIWDPVAEGQDLDTLWKAAEKTERLPVRR